MHTTSCEATSVTKRTHSFTTSVSADPCDSTVNDNTIGGEACGVAGGTGCDAGGGGGAAAAAGAAARAGAAEPSAGTRLSVTDAGSVAGGTASLEVGATGASGLASVDFQSSGDVLEGNEKLTRAPPASLTIPVCAGPSQFVPFACTNKLVGSGDDVFANGGSTSIFSVTGRDGAAGSSTVYSSERRECSTGCDENGLCETTTIVRSYASALALRVRRTKRSVRA